MWIKSIVIDGFKSYAVRTVVSGWDPSFNAITGLNGSGKSNILDAICFVLGISNLSQVRARNLQDLVYKQGQARVTKASVTIVFDNIEKTMSPVGYEHIDEITVTRQVQLGGRNKYMINGHTAQASKVQNLFHSVQLNVNNPHFLIMQGRITKVVNMKPPEVLSMIEEASGTRMYETKKNSAIKTIQKKQSKVDEINKILTEEITPTLERLRQERSTYLQWSRAATEIAEIERRLIASSFFTAEETLQTSTQDIQGVEDQKKELEEKGEEMNAELNEKNKLIAEATKEKEKNLQNEFRKLEKDVEQKSKDLVKQTSVWQTKKDACDAERKNRDQLKSSIEEIKGSIRDKEKDQKKTKQQVEQVIVAHKALTEKVSLLQSQLLGVSMSDKEKDQGTLASQLMESQRIVTEAEGELQQAETKTKYLKAQLKDKERKTKGEEKQISQLKADSEKKQKELAQVEQELKKHHYDEKERLSLEQKVSTVEAKVMELREKRDRLRARLAQVQFDFADPHPGFDRRKVKGLVAQLAQLNDAKAALALEVAAGGRLYHVVVDTHETGKQLLAKGKLKRRVTIIPLNKIAQQQLSPEIVAKAEQLVGRDNARIALSLVGYDKEVEAAMKFVFGGTFVCKDSKTAVKVTFDKEIKTRAVTLEGDLMDPSGTLTGGSRPQGAGILIQLTELSETANALDLAEKDLRTTKDQHAKVVQAEDAVRELVNRKELLAHELELSNQRFQQSSYAKLSAEVTKLTTELKELEASMDQAQEKRDKAAKRCGELERSIRDFEKEKKSKMKELDKELATEKKNLTGNSKAAKDAEQKLERMELEIKDLRQDQKNTEDQFTKCEESLNKLEEEVDGLSKRVADQKDLYDRSQEKLDSEKEKLAAADKRITALQKERTKLTKQISESDLEVKKLQHKLQRMATDASEAKKRVEVLLKKHEWIAAERHNFGKPSTDFDFKKHTPKASQARLAKLKTEQETLAKKINKKVMGMYEKAEQDYQDLIKKRDIIEKDKKKIEEVIDELDRKKNEALEKTWKKVTKDFGSIFSTLLPGTQAKLTPPEGKTVLDGLEMKVGFGGVWKASLSELSGGQRSLLALSLILALLLFKPAPMYILDEIDAALDLSHTQNIGQMLKTHFPQSQFIVVSLKEGMFNHANVVFRTKVVDGVSTVRRTAMEHNKGQKNVGWVHGAAQGKRRKPSERDTAATAPSAPHDGEEG